MHKKKKVWMIVIVIMLVLGVDFVCWAKTEKKDNYIMEYEELLDAAYEKMENLGEGEHILMLTQNKERDYIDELAAYFFYVYDYTGEVQLMESVSEINPYSNNLFINVKDGTQVAGKQKETVFEIMRFCNEIEDSNEMEKIKKIHDWIKSTTEYDFSYSKNSCYSALIEGKSACNGYARLFTAVCSYAGIECENITGWQNDKYHIWNRVRVNGIWYYIDVTWNDSAGEDRWFMISRDQMNRDHIEEGNRKNISRTKEV